MKYFELVPFDVRVTADVVVHALDGDDADGNETQALKTEESDQ